MLMVGDDLLVDKRTYPLWRVVDVLPAIEGELLVSCPGSLQRQQASHAYNLPLGFSNTQTCVPDSGI